VYLMYILRVQLQVGIVLHHLPHQIYHHHRLNGFIKNQFVIYQTNLSDIYFFLLLFISTKKKNLSGRFLLSILTNLFFSSFYRIYHCMLLFFVSYECFLFSPFCLYRYLCYLSNVI
jgi:hypothetical protein